MKLCPGDFVVLERMAAQLLSDSFQLSADPSPSYVSRVVGSFTSDQLGFVLEVHREGQPSEEEFAKILTPDGIGWLNVYYLERSE